MLIKNLYHKRLNFGVFEKMFSIGSGTVLEVDEKIGKELLKSPWIEQVKPEIKEKPIVKTVEIRPEIKKKLDTKIVGFDIKKPIKEKLRKDYKKVEYKPSRLD